MQIITKIHYVLGSHHLLNSGNHNLALRNLIKARLLGSSDASALLGFMFEYGLGPVQVDFVVAERLYKEASDSNNGLALARLAFLKMHGRPNIKIDQLEAEKCKAICKKMGSNAIRWLQMAADHKLPAAQLSLGLCYYNGIGVDENDSAAFKLFFCAADSGLPSAQNMIGNMYVEGSGTERNYSLGIKWYIKAAESKEAAAMFNIGTMFERGLGLEQDYVEAYSWYLRAAIYGSTIAMNVLGIFNENGLGMEIRFEEAVKWYSKGASRGHAHAQYNLARCYYDGCGVEQNSMRALELFTLAADQHHERGLLTTAICHEHGIGTTPNKKLSMEYYAVAAKRGSAYAQKRLAPVVATELLVQAKILLRPKRPQGMMRVDSGYFEGKELSSNSRSNHPDPVQIQSLPRELLIGVIECLNYSSILSKKQISIILSQACQPSCNSLTEFLNELSINPVPKLKCACNDKCNSITHYMDLFN